MRSVKSGLVALAVAGSLGMAAIIGCSASGGDGTVDDSTPTDPSAQLPAPSQGSSGSTDTGGTDSGTKKQDSGKDAGPPPPNPGDPCAKADATVSKTCGKCGTQQAICQAAGDGGALVWSDYGQCENELTGPDVCAPGDKAACGNCGTHTCGNYCAWGACTGEPANSCSPGASDYTSAGCTQPSTYKKRDCGNTCQWGSYSTTCAAPVNDVVINISGTVGGTVTQAITLSTAKQGNRVSGFTTCPGADITSGKYPFAYVEVHNATAKAATVTAYNAVSGTGPAIDTVMVGYSVPIQPMNDTMLAACAFGPDDQSSGDTSLTGDANFAIIKNIAIPAGGSVLIDTSSYYESTSTTDTTTGTISLKIKTDALN